MSNDKNIELSIESIRNAILYSGMDKSSLSSYIGNMIANIDNISLKDKLSGIISNTLELKTELSQNELVAITNMMTEVLENEINSYEDIKDLQSEENIIIPISDRLSFTDNLGEVLTSEDALNEYTMGIVSDSILNDEIQTSKKNVAFERFQSLSEKIKNKISNIKQNIVDNCEQFANKDINFWVKSILGFTADFIGGNLLSKLYYDKVSHNEDMFNKIKEEGIIHFTSKEAVGKILNSDKNYIKSSGLLLSGGKKRSYFFAGIPSFDNYTVNIYSNNVIYGVRIHPTDEQIQELEYREYNDLAVANRGDFVFDKSQAEPVYCGLKIDANGNPYYEEITEEEALNYQISDELKKVYNGNGTILHHIMCNALGFYYEYQNYTRLIKRLKNRVINNSDELLESDIKSR